MAEDKYAPGTNDGPKEVHSKHLSLIKQQQEENKKARENVKKAPAKTHEVPAVEPKPEEPQPLPDGHLS